MSNLADDIKFLAKPFNFVRHYKQSKRYDLYFTERPKREQDFSKIKWNYTFPKEEILDIITINGIPVKIAQTTKGIYATTDKSTGIKTKRVQTYDLAFQSIKQQIINNK